VITLGLEIDLNTDRDIGLNRTLYPNENLDPAQQAVVEHEQGPLVVLAGPGTGKTRVLTCRVARLAEKGLASPRDVLAVTFTRKAAAEMRERVQLLLGYDVNELNISTIHSLAYRILHSGQVLLTQAQGKKRLHVLEPGEAFGVLKRAALETGLTPNRWDPEMLFGEIQRAKDRLVGPDEYVRVPGSYFEEHVARAYRRYQQILEEEGKLDLADLIWKAVRLLRNNPALLAHLRALSPYVVVDEFQDTSMGQYELLRLLAEQSRNLFVVASPAQALYGWRGAHVDRLLTHVHHDFPEVREVTLESNYRSTGTIVRASREVVDGRYRDAALVPVREQGDLVVVARLPTPDDEAAFVAAETSHLHEDGMPWNEMAVLYRTHRQAYVLEKCLAQAGVPYTLGEGRRLYQREEVTQVLAYLRLAQDPDALGALDTVVNVPPRGIGPNSLRRIKQGRVHLTAELLAQAIAEGLNWGLREQVVEAVYELHCLITQVLPQKADLPPAELIQFVLDATGFVEWLRQEFDGQRRLAGIHQLQEDTAEFPHLADFLDYARERTDGFFESGRGVQLSTIHAAKGLEFDAVLVVGLEEGMLPHARALKTARDPAEERRLCYVAMTRARDRLYMLCSRTRATDGRAQPRRPSRYFGDLPRSLLEQRR